MDLDYLENIKSQLREKISNTGTWIYSSEGKLVTKIIASIGSFVVGDPTGFVLPFILESSDVVIRKRFLKHFPDLVNRLEQNRERLNHNYLKSSEGQKMLKDTLRSIIQETNEEKIEYLKKFLLTSYTTKKPNSELINTFFRILINMEPIHIKLLTVLKNPKEIMIYVANERKKNPRPVESRPHGKNDCAVYWSENKYDDLNNFYLHSDPVVYSNAHKDLVTWNILETKFHMFWLYFDQTTFDVNLDGHLREIERWTTPFGKKFLEYVYDNNAKVVLKPL